MYCTTSSSTGNVPPGTSSAGMSAQAPGSPGSERAPPCGSRSILHDTLMYYTTM